jgi:hypothetical protein
MFIKDGLVGRRFLYVGLSFLNNLDKIIMDCSGFVNLDCFQEFDF